MAIIQQKIRPCLWFDTNAEEAARFYTSIFKKSKIRDVARYGDAGAKAAHMPKGMVMTVVFELEGQSFLALNGGPIFKFTPAISLMVYCKTQKEIDELWEKLSAGGQKSQCGWLTDKFGLSWQIVPATLGKLVSGKNPKRSERVMSELMKMTKLDIKTLGKAYQQR